jgi:hypothetical protein
MSDTHLRVLRRIAAMRRSAVRISASIAPDDPGEHRERLAEASVRADAQLTAATNRRRRRARSRRDGDGERAPDSV